MVMSFSQISGRMLKLLSSDYVLYLGAPVAKALVSIVVLIPVTTYYLDPKDFGLFALMTAIAMPMTGLAPAGSRWMIGGNYVSLDDSGRKELIFNVLLFELALRTGLLLVLFMIAPWVLSLVIQDAGSMHLELLRLSLVALWLGALWPSISYLMTVQNRPARFALLSVIQVLVNLLVALILLWGLGFGVEALFLALLATNAVSLFLELAYVRRHLIWRPSVRLLKEIARTAIRSTPGGLAEVTSTMTERISIQHFVSTASLGIYSHSQQYQVAIKMANGALSNAMTPATLRIYTHGKDSIEIKPAFKAWYGLLACIGIVVAFFTGDVVAWLTHGKFVDATPLVMIWFLLSYSVAHSIPYAQFLIARKQSRVLMYTHFIPTLLGIGLFVLAVRQGEIYWAATILVLVNSMVQLSRYVIARKQGFEPAGDGAALLSLCIYLAAVAVEQVFTPAFGIDFALAGGFLLMIGILYRLPVSLRAILSIRD